MKFLFATLVILTAAVAIALFANEDPGYIMISYREWTIEASLVLAVTFILLSFFVLYYAIRFLSNTHRIPRRLQNWSQQRQTRKAREAMTHGLIELAEGKWAAAEKHLIKYIERSETPLLNYISAARAAQKQGAHDRRDHYLRLANQKFPKADIAVALTQAELQISHGQMEQALATLSNLQKIVPKHRHVQKLLMRLYIELHDWERLIELLPKLRKHNTITLSESEQIETNAYTELLKLASGDKHANTLADIWQRVPKRIKQHDAILIDYIRHLINSGETAQAESLIHQTLSRHWNETLAYLYGTVSGDQPSKQLSRAESWLKKHHKNPILLLTLGRLCMRNNLWGKARQYLEVSANLSDHPETYNELGNVLEQIGEKDAAANYFRKGLMLSVSMPTQLTISNDTLPKNENGLMSQLQSSTV